MLAGITPARRVSISDACGRLPRPSTTTVAGSFTTIVTACRQISVVIPGYNREALIGRAIESVLAQSVRPAEVIVVDDGSTDGTAAEVERYRGVDRVVRGISQPNRGPGSARNRGVRAAAGPWIAFLDSDDLWREGHLERLWSAVEETGGGGRFYFCDLERPVDGVPTSHWQRCGFAPGPGGQTAEDGADWVLLHKRPQMLQASLMRRDDYLSVGGIWPRLRMNEDGHLFAKLAVGRPIVAVDGVGVEMTDDADAGERLFATGSRRRTVAYQEELVDVYDDLLVRFPDAAPRHRDIFRHRRSAAHRRLVRMLAAEGDVLGAARHLGHAVAADPRTVLRRGAHRLAHAAGSGS